MRAICGTIFAVCVVAAGSPLPAVTLTAGKTEVVLGGKPTRVAQFAAEEMTNFLSRVFGAPVPVVSKPTSGKTGIWLGVGADVGGLARDEFVIKAEPGRVVIAGRDSAKDDPKRCVANGNTSQYYERATLFGVYEFLERFARCRFYFPGELGEIVPRRQSIAVPCGEIRVKPDMMARRVYSGGGSSPKARDGVWFEERPKESDGKALNWLRLRFETENRPCCHGLNKFNYVERFGKTKPEYFALLKDGTRSNNPNKRLPGQLCLTSGIYEEIYQDVRAYFKGEKAAVRGLERWGSNCVDGRYVDVMCQDGMVACRCQKCQAEYARCAEIYGRDHDYADNWATELVWSNTCAIARRLTEEGIKGVVTQMAYYPYRHVPRMDIPGNVDVMVAERGPWSVPYPEEMKAQIDEIRSWAEKLGRPVWIWTYPGKYTQQAYPGIPHMTPRCIGAFYKAAAPYIFGSSMESESDRFLYGYLNYYVVSRIFWDRNSDVDAILKEHYDLMFGPAAPEMDEFYRTIERKWVTGIVGNVTDTPLGPVSTLPSAFDVWTKVYSRDVLNELRGLLASASAKVSPGSLEARRIELMRSHVLGGLEEEFRKYMDRIDPKVEEAWRAAHPGLCNIVANGDFSVGRIGASHSFGKRVGQEMVGWYGSRDSRETDLDTQVFHSAPASMRIAQSETDLSKKSHSGIRQYVADGERRLKPNTRYRLSFFVKLDNVSPLKRGGGVVALVWDDDKSLRFPTPAAGGGPLTGTTDWIAQSYEFTSGPNTNGSRKSYVDLCISGATGTIWVDDVRLEVVPDASLADRRQ